jgi:RNA polymerase sigma-70 factor (ECF subfamily)
MVDRKVPSPSGGAQQFQTTHWSLVGRAAEQLQSRAADEARRQALADLIRRYLPALRTFLIYRRRLDCDAADDILQEFIAEKVLQKGLLAHASKERGRFRMFLMSALDRFALSQFRKQRAKKRFAPDSVPVEEEMDAADASQLAPDEPSAIAWARQLLHQALDRMRQECERTDRADVWGVFEARLLNPMLHQADPVGYEELVARFKLGSPAQASNVFITSKRTFARVLRQLIGEYECSEEQIEAEISELMAVLARAKD